jgi:hypothetical protein
MPGGPYDYIIVGAGSAGCVLPDGSRIFFKPRKNPPSASEIDWKSEL